jgi:hypothetical protein
MITLLPGSTSPFNVTVERFIKMSSQAKPATDHRLKSLLVIDFETTSLPEQDPDAEIVEAAVAIFDVDTGAIRSRWSTLVQHTRPMSDFTADKFSGVDFTGAMTLREAMCEIEHSWLTSRGAWTGQNPDFDLGFARRAFADCNIPWPKYPDVDYHILDVASMAFPYVARKEISRVSLRNTREWAGLKGGQTHRAMGDVDDSIEVMRYIFGRTVVAANPLQRAAVICGTHSQCCPNWNPKFIVEINGANCSADCMADSNAGALRHVEIR